MLVAVLLLSLLFVASLVIVNVYLYVPAKKIQLWFFNSFLSPRRTADACSPSVSALEARIDEKGNGGMGKKAELKRVFATFDRNGDGFITSQELRESLEGIRMVMTEMEVDEMVRNSDVNGDGLIDFDEFRGLLESGNVGGKEGGEEEEDLKEAFDVFDKDKDGLITVEELGSVLCCLGMKEGKRVDACEEMIRKVDVDGDGMVSFDEFKRMMRGGQRLVSVY